MKQNPLKLPPELASLPRMSWTTQPAPADGAPQRPDVAYGIRSADALVNEFEKRETKLTKG